MEKQIKLDATQFAVASLALLNMARQKNSHCDFIIQVGDLILPVHKNVLAIRSEYFEIMFRIEAKESKSGRVIMKGVDKECVVKCIDYLYTGNASILDKKIREFLHVAHLMQLHELCNDIAKLLKEGLNSKSFFETKKLADIYNLKDLENTCDDFARRNFEAVSKEETFEELERDYVELLLKSPNTVGAETVKFDAILKWIHSKPDERNELFPEMLGYINLAKLPPRYYKHLLQEEPLVYESASILRNFTLSMMKTEVIGTDALVLYDTESQSFYANRSATSPAIFSSTKLMDAPKQHRGGNFTIVHWQKVFYVVTSTGALYSIECDDSGAKWSTLQSMKQPQNPPLAVVSDGVIHVIGNCGGEKYNIEENKWSAMPPRETVNYNPIYYSSNSSTIVSPATDSGIAVVEGMIYIVGGKISENGNQQTNCYDPRNRPLSRNHPLFSRQGRAQRQLQRRHGEPQPIHGVSNVQRYDTRSLQWVDSYNMNNPRYNVGVAAKEQNLYAIGGAFSNEVPETNFVECLNTGIDRSRWMNVVKLPFALSMVSACEAGGKIYAVGSTKQNVTTVLEFKESNQWVEVNFDGEQQWSSRIALCVTTLV